MCSFIFILDIVGKIKNILQICYWYAQTGSSKNNDTLNGLSSMLEIVLLGQDLREGVDELYWIRKRGSNL